MSIVMRIEGNHACRSPFRLMNVFDNSIKSDCGTHSVFIDLDSACRACDCANKKNRCIHCFAIVSVDGGWALDYNGELVLFVDEVEWDANNSNCNGVLRSLQRSIPN